MRKSVVTKALLAALVLAHTCPVPAAAQDRSLRIDLALEAKQVWRSQAKHVIFVAEFKNRLGEKLRWDLPDPQGLYCALCLQRSDGVLYRATTQVERTYVSGGLQRTSALLAPRQTVFTGGVIGGVQEAEGNGFFARFVEEALENGSRRSVPAFEGDLPEGVYDVWLQIIEGPPLNETYPERSPRKGVYKSNRVRLKVVADGTQLPADRHRAFKKGTGPLLALNGRLYAYSEALVPYGIERKVLSGDDLVLVLARGQKWVEAHTPRRSGPRSGWGGLHDGELPIVGDSLLQLNPKALAYLGLRIKPDKTRRLYDLVPLDTPPRNRDESLRIELALDAAMVSTSRARRVRFVATFQNRTKEPLRWHPPEDFGSYPCSRAP